MKKIICLSVCFLTACTTLTRQETSQLRELNAQGVTIDKPVGNFEKPASSVAAGALNLLPGVGNFYLGTGNTADSSQVLYGFLNLLTWPTSILWAVPQGAIDANTINKREMLYYYTYDIKGKKELKKAGIKLSE